MKIDSIKAVALSNNERERIRHLDAMVMIMSGMIDHEDKHGTAMTQEQIVEAFRSPEYDAEMVLFEMLELTYVVCSVDLGPMETRGDTVINTICYAWGTTFFGREWYRGIRNMTLPHQA